jgi:SH3-like domain-containing protein
MRFVTAVTISIFILLAPYISYSLCVSAERANFRSGPGTEYEKLWQGSRHTTLKKVGASVSGEWYAVSDVDDDVMWVHKSLVNNDYSCATVRKERINVRTGPGTRYGKKFPEPATKYDSFLVLKISGAWVKVKDANANVGWIHRSGLWIN